MGFKDFLKKAGNAITKQFNENKDMALYGHSERAIEIERATNTHEVNMERERRMMEMEMSTLESNVNNMKLKKFTQTAVIYGGFGIAGLALSIIIYKSF